MFSTCATYGNPEVMPITELTPTEPINPYGKVRNGEGKHKKCLGFRVF